MATDLEDKQGVYDDAEHDSVQRHYDDAFNQLTSSGHYNKNTEEPNTSGSVEDIANRENFYNPYDAGSSTSSNSPGEIEKAESTKDSTATGFYNASDNRINFFQKGKAKAKGLLKHKGLLAGAGIGGFALLALMLALVFFASLLKIPDLAQHITEYEFATVTRQFAQSAQRTSDEALAIEAAGEGTAAEGATAEAPKGVYGALRDKYQSLRDNTWGKLDKVRPSQVINTLGDKNSLELHFTTSSLTGRKILTGATIDGVDYTIEQVSGIAKWTPFLRGMVDTKNQIAFTKAFAPALENAMKANEVGPIIRGLVANDIRKQANISLISWNVAKFNNDDPQKAQLEETREKYQRVNAAEGAADNAVTEEISQAEQAAKEAEQQTINNDASLQAAIENNGMSTAVDEAISKSISSSLTKNVLGVIDPLYGIATPVCIVYDGSVKHSGPTINNQANMQQAAYYYIASAADQQKAGTQGATDAPGLATAIGATNSDLGDITQTIPEQRASGATVDTSGVTSAEAGADGSYAYDIYDALGMNPSSPEGKALSYVTSNFCSVLTNGATAAGIGILNIGAALLSFGTSEAAEQTAGQGARAFITAFVKDSVSNMFAKQVEKKGVQTIERSAMNRAMRFMFKQGVTVTGTVGATELANLIVAERAGQVTSGLAQGTDLVDNADAGANIQAGQIERAQLFGRPLTSTEAAARDQADTVFVADQNSTRSYTDRYFAFSNADSLISHVAMSLSTVIRPTIASSLINLGSSLFQPLKYVGSLLNLSGITHAAPDPTTQHYGNVQFAWSQDEENIIDSNTSYTPLENERILESELTASGHTEGDITNDYAQCFGYHYNPSGDGSFDPTDLNSDMQLDTTGNGSLGNLLASGDIQRDKNGNVIDGGTCSPTNLGPHNPQFGDMVFRWRLAMSYDTTLNQLTNEQGVSAQ